MVDRGLPLADLLAQEWSVLQPSEDRPEQAQLAVSPTGRAAHVYLLPADGDTADHGEVSESLAATEGVDLVCWLESARRNPAAAARGGGPDRRGGLGGGRARAAAGCASGPGPRSPTCAAPAGTSRGTTAPSPPTVEDGRLRSDRYPDPLARVFSALTRAARRRPDRLPRARLRGARLGRRQPRRRRQPRLAAPRRLARPAPVLRLRPRGSRRARPVDPARRRARRARPLRTVSAERGRL